MLLRPEGSQLTSYTSGGSGISAVCLKPRHKGGPMEMMPASERRTIYVSAVDATGRTIPAEIGVVIDHHSAGSVRLGRDAPRATIEVRGIAEQVKLIARHFDQRLEAQLGRHEDKYEFEFPSMIYKESPPAPEARCPDGTTGVPCVVCKIGAISVRLCV